MEPVIDLNNYHHTSSQYKEDPKHHPKTSRVYMFGIFGGTILFLCAGIMLWLTYSAPRGFQKNTLFLVEKGQSVSQVAHRLEGQSIIHSPLIFRVYVAATGCSKSIREGEYLFVHEHSIFSVARRMCSGDFGVSSVRVLLREGLSRSEIADTLSGVLPFFDAKEFLRITENKEGYLFPDTYIFYKTVTAEKVAQTLFDNFDKKTQELRESTSQSDSEWKDTIIVASLLEMEGKTEIDKQMIADIIYRRMNIGMPLQLDAPFLYFMNKASLQLTKNDLLVDSPYNTYRHKGLPPTPIASPGLESIRAALYPKHNTHMYYLSDANGKIYYADTFEQHKQNKQKYLR